MYVLRVVYVTNWLFFFFIFILFERQKWGQRQGRGKFSIRFQMSTAAGTGPGWCWVLRPQSGSPKWWQKPKLRNWFGYRGAKTWRRHVSMRCRHPKQWPNHCLQHLLNIPDFSKIINKSIVCEIEGQTHELLLFRYNFALLSLQKI